MGFAAVVALVAAAGFARLGLRRDWHLRSTLLRLWSLAAVVALGLTVWAGVTLQREHRRGIEKGALAQLWQIRAAADQWFLEYPNRMFVTYDELIGPTRYVKASNPVAGEDLHATFPIRRELPDFLNYCAVLPDGRTIGFQPTDPPKPDGVDVVKLPDGRRLETTYRGGVPDGPFRAYYPDGELWSEATYVKGRVSGPFHAYESPAGRLWSTPSYVNSRAAGPCWLYTRDGRRFDELKDGEAAETAQEASAKASASEAVTLGVQQLKTGDFRGAIAALTQALAINPTDVDLYRSRGDAKKALGDIDGAIADYCSAEGTSPDRAMDSMLPDPLANLFLERGRLRQAKGDDTGAMADFRVFARTALWRAGWKTHDHERDYTGVVKLLSTAIELVPLAELHEARADTRRVLGDFTGAEADYTRAIELAAQGVMQIPANGYVLPAHWTYKRAHMRRLSGNLPGAVEDFRAAAPGLSFSALIQRPAAMFWLFLVECEQGRKPEAIAELARTDKSGWTESDRQFARLLQGESTEAELNAFLAPNHNDDMLFHAAFFNAMLRRFAGDRAGALVRFHAAVLHGTYDDFASDEVHHTLIAEARSVGVNKLLAGNSAGARRDFEQALRWSEPASADLLELLADAIHGQGQFENALGNYRNALASLPAGADASLRSRLEEKIAAVTREVESNRQPRVRQQPAAHAPTPGSPVTVAGQNFEAAANTGGQPAVRPPPPAPLLIVAGRKFTAGDFAGASADYTRVIELQPDVSAYVGRANARRALGDIDGAIADYTDALRRAPEMWAARYNRAHLRRLKQDLPGAVEDFRAAVVAELKTTSRWAVSRAACWLYFTECERGRATEAAVELAQTFAKMGQAKPAANANAAEADEWDRQVAELLLGRITEEQLLAKLDAVAVQSRNDHRFKALFFGALQRRQAGDQPGALELFRQALAVPNNKYFEFEVAEASRAVAGK